MTSDRPLGGPPLTRPAVFLDRDGVINRDVGFAHRPEQIDWMPGVVEAIATANRDGVLVLIVTNQSGVARGLFDEETVQSLHRWMWVALMSRGARIDDFAYCPHLLEGTVARYALACECRKPAAGMIEMLLAKHDVDRARSFLIGDKPSDLQAARAARIGGMLYEGGSLLPYMSKGLAAFTR